MPTLADVKARLEAGPFLGPLYLGGGEVAVKIYEACKDGRGLIVDGLDELRGQEGYLLYAEHEGLRDAVDHYLDRIEAEDLAAASGCVLVRDADGGWHAHRRHPSEHPL